MIQVRPSEERGVTRLPWLDSRHTFSFDQYYDPNHMHFRHLRVLNEDRVQAGKGFGTHPHRDMEIITYVLEGALEHKDSMGNGAPIRPGEVQRMSAGTGITHSEFNPSQTDPVHLLQIWILPERRGLPPGYEQKAFPLDAAAGKLTLIGAHDARDGAVHIHQDVDLYAARLRAGEEVSYSLKPGRYAWLQLARGVASLNGVPLRAGDGAAVSEEQQVRVRADENSEFLLFDLP